MTNIEIRIKGKYESLSEAEKKAADYFLKNPMDVVSMPVSTLAENSGVSSAAWIRLCKSIGYEGLKDLRHQLFDDQNRDIQKHKKGSGKEIFSDLNEGASSEQILQSVASITEKAVLNTARILQPDALEKAADAIQHADSVRMFGMGASSLVAEDFYNKLLRIGINAVFSKDSHVQLGYSSTLTKKSVAIFISDKGQTQEVLQALQEARRHGCITIGITRYSKSTLSRSCDILLYTSSPEAYIRSGAMSSRIAQLMVVDVLFTIIASADYDRIRQPLENSYKICQKHRSENVDKNIR